MCLTGDNMRKFNEIYEMMKYGYELINRAYTKEDAAKYATRIRRAGFTYEARIIATEVNLPDE